MHTDSNQPGDSEHTRVLRLVQRHGFNATAFQTLEQGYRHTFIDDDACVAYVDTGRAWVVAGAPIAAPERLRAVTSAFLVMARAARRRCCFFATEPRFLEATEGALHALRLGEQPVWDPREWVSIVQRHRSLREQLRRARAKGVVVRELDASDLSRMHAGITELAERWKATRKMAPMGFLVQLAPFELAAHRRYFVAERGGQLLGFAALVPVPARAGWFVDHLLRDPRAPNGTGELMIDAAMRGVAASGCDWLTLGMAPLAGEVTPPLRAARRGGAMFYDFEGLRAYKAKLRPEQWTPLYLSYPASQGMWISVLDVLSAFARGGLVRFALRSLRHGAPAVLRGLVVLLVPWTLLLALVPGERWFGAEWIRWAWVGFDVLLLVLLVRALRVPSTRLLTLLTAVVALDALVTTMQAMLWNLPRAHGVLDLGVMLVACAGPALAAAALWGVRRNRLRRG